MQKVSYKGKTDHSFQLNYVTKNVVKSQLQNLEMNKAVGIAKMSSRLLIDSADIIAPSLQTIINKYFLERKFPCNWKSTNVMHYLRVVIKVVVTMTYLFQS